MVKKDNYAIIWHIAARNNGIMPFPMCLSETEHKMVTEIRTHLCRIKHIKHGNFQKIYIVIHKEIVSLYHNSTVWLDILDARSWNRNPPYFMLDLVSPSASCRAASTDIPDPLSPLFPYRPSPLAGLQGYIPYPQLAAECMFVLVVLLLPG